MSHDERAAASMEQFRQSVAGAARPAVRADRLVARGAEFGQRVQLYNALGGGWPVDNAPQANLNMPASPAKE